MVVEHVQVAKVLGADVELGNFIEGLDDTHGTGPVAARLLLKEIDGVLAIPGATFSDGWAGSYQTSSVPIRSAYYGYRADSLDDAYAAAAAATCEAQEVGRRFLPTNAGCAYIDLDHLELAQPETRSAVDFVAYGRAMLMLARRALDRANGRLVSGRRLVALANCSDGHGHSYGAHLNVLLTRAAWENICVRRPHYLAYLTAFQASSIVYTGSGKVGSENGRPPVAFQLAQRADFFETLVGPQTTFNRPIVNTRDEPLCGARLTPADGEPELARLHVIFYDHTLAQVATFLKAGTMQIIVSLLEAGVVDPGLALDDPLDALMAWSRDPTLTVRARTVGGDAVTAVELQSRFLGAARRFADTGGLDACVPRAAEILATWQDTLSMLGAKDFTALARRLDWVLKLRTLERVLASHPELTWASPELKHLDMAYASLDADEGLFWAFERDGLVDVVVTDDAVARALCEPPPDTRAWTRAHLLRLAGDRQVEHVDWDFVRLKTRLAERPWVHRTTVDLPRPTRGGEAERGALFARGLSLDEVAAQLMRADWNGRHVALANVRP